MESGFNIRFQLGMGRTDLFKGLFKSEPTFVMCAWARAPACTPAHTRVLPGGRALCIYSVVRTLY